MKGSLFKRSSRSLSDSEFVLTDDTHKGECLPPLMVLFTKDQDVCKGYHFYRNPFPKVKTLTIYEYFEEKMCDHILHIYFRDCQECISIVRCFSR